MFIGHDFVLEMEPSLDRSLKVLETKCPKIFMGISSISWHDPMRLPRPSASINYAQWSGAGCWSSGTCAYGETDTMPACAIHTFNA